MTTTSLIQAKQLCKNYGARVAVSNLNLQLNQGEILGLLGPNGAGKSTTLKMLSGCLAPSSGSVRINGVGLADDPITAKRAIGYLPERPPVYPELTVDEYLGFCVRLHGVAKAKRKTAIAAAKQDAGLTDMGRRIIGNLSKGYQQRVGVAQSIVHRPPVVILDEPTVGLDPNQIREMRRLIRGLGQQHSVIVSSHILSEIQATCDRVVIISQGHTVFSETMEAVNAAAKEGHIRLQLHNPPGIDSLRAISGIAQVEEVGNGHFNITAASNADPRSQLAERAVRENWGLLELATVHKTLEDIFVELTTRDASPARIGEAA